MKKKLILTGAIAVLIILFACAFKIDGDSSIKDITHPYINTYECTRATLGESDLLDDYEYLRIIIEEGGQMKIIFKQKDGKSYQYESTYSYDEKTRELTAEMTILGYRYKQKTTIENGKFTIAMPLFSKQLVMVFEVQ